jgi:hypothetical protein
VEIDGRTVDCVSEGMPIEAGQIVKVIDVRGVRVVVRAVDDQSPPDPRPPTTSSSDLPPLSGLELDELDERE